MSAYGTKADLSSIETVERASLLPDRQTLLGHSQNEVAPRWPRPFRFEVARDFATDVHAVPSYERCLEQ